MSTKASYEFVKEDGQVWHYYREMVSNDDYLEYRNDEGIYVVIPIPDGILKAFKEQAKKLEITSEDLEKEYQRGKSDRLDEVVEALREKYRLLI
jgi:predicted RNA-binding protein